MATLSYLNFLPDVVQRTAVSTAAAIAARTTGETMPLALEALPHLLSLLDDCKDSQILNSACSALDHITNAAAKYGSGPCGHVVCGTMHSKLGHLATAGNPCVAAGATLEQPYTRLQRMESLTKPLFCWTSVMQALSRAICPQQHFSCCCQRQPNVHTAVQI